MQMTGYPKSESPHDGSKHTGITDVSGAPARLCAWAPFREKSIRGCAWYLWLLPNQTVGNIFVTEVVNQ